MRVSRQGAPGAFREERAGTALGAQRPSTMKCTLWGDLAPTWPGILILEAPLERFAWFYASRGIPHESIWSIQGRSRHAQIEAPLERFARLRLEVVRFVIIFDQNHCVFSVKEARDTLPH